MLLLLLSFLVQLNTTPVSQSNYEITFETRHIDLGEIKKGEIREFEYTFVNTGDEDISILVVSACECSTLDWTRRTIKPSESGKVSVSFDSGKKDDPDPVDVELYLENIDPTTEANRAEIVSFEFQIIE